MKKLIIISSFILLSSTLVFAQNLIERTENQPLITEKEQFLFNNILKDITTIKASFVKIDLNQLESNEISFELESKKYKLTRLRYEKRHEKSYTLLSKIKDLEGSFSFSVQDDDILCHIYLNSKFYEILTINKSKYVLREYDQSKYGGCGTKHQIQNDNKIIQSKSPINHKSSHIEPCSLRIMVCYTPAVTALLSGLSGSLNLCHDAIANMNESFINSGISHRAQLAYAGEVVHTENDQALDDVNAFRNPADGIMDEIHDLRNFYSADVCVLLSTSSKDPNGNPICGVSASIFGNQPHTFCQVRYTCALNDFTFNHEVGHILGGRHNSDTKILPFAHGHGFESANYRSIMAVLSSKPRVNYWSSPNITYSTQVLGDATIANMVDVLNNTITDFRTFRDPTTNQLVNNIVVTDKMSYGSIIDGENITTSGEVNFKIYRQSQLQAAQSITLTDGFTAQQGTSFISNIYSNPECSGNPNAGGTDNGGEIFDIALDPVFIQNSSKIDIHVFPNPVIHKLYLKKEHETNLTLKVQLTNIKGIVLHESNMNSFQEIDFKNYQSGIYFLKISTDNKSNIFKITHKKNYN